MVGRKRERPAKVEFVMEKNIVSVLLGPRLRRWLDSPGSYLIGTSSGRKPRSGIQSTTDRGASKPVGGCDNTPVISYEKVCIHETDEVEIDYGNFKRAHSEIKLDIMIV